MSEPQKIETQFESIAGCKPHLFHKCLLSQYAQKSKKEPPVYQIHNEGVEHHPKFRSTVWFDGTSYTSPNTFLQRKMAEEDASKVAFLAVMQQIKDEASHLIREDSVLAFAKSILVEYAVRMNLEKPSYQTIQPNVSLPVFISSLVFKGVTYTGDIARSKKEAEQLAARSVILKLLDSESGNAISELIKSKFDQVKESCNIHNGTNSVGVQVQSGYDTAILLSKANEVKADEGSSNMPIPFSVPCFAQPTSIPAMCPPDHLISEPSLAQSTTPAISDPCFAKSISIPATVFQKTPVISANMSSSSAISEPCLGQFTSIPETHLPWNAIQPPTVDALMGTVAPAITSVSPVVDQMQFVGLTTTKKRNRKNKKNAQKKMRVEAQLPIVAAPLSQVAPCSVAQ